MVIHKKNVDYHMALGHNGRMYKRFLPLVNFLEKKSHFLFGPRSTGKTTLIRQLFPGARLYDLLEPRTYGRILNNPSLLEEEHREEGEIVIIDEIQKFPALLDEIHRLIELKKYRFLLTGSSARKLKRGGANLLAGRAWWASLFPLTSHEIPHFDLITYLNRGGLPFVYDSPDYGQELEAYTALYLKEEVQNEALTRNVRAFSESLLALALSNGREINYDNMASDLQVSPGTLKNYVGILEDTLLGFKLPGYTKTKKRKAISRFKYYFFDLGVVNSLCQRGEIKPKSEHFGRAFEHFILLEIRAFLSYHGKTREMRYWRSTSQFEVDLLVDDTLALEIKSSHLVQNKDLKGIRALKEENLMDSYMVVSLDTNHRQTSDGIHILPWREFLESLWKGNIL